MAGAMAGGALAHHERTKAEEEQQAYEQPAYDQSPAEEQAPADQQQGAYAPPPADPADELEHLGQLHESGVLTDEEFASAKAKILGT